MPTLAHSSRQCLNPTLFTRIRFDQTLPFSTTAPSRNSAISLLGQLFPPTPPPTDATSPSTRRPREVPRLALDTSLSETLSVSRTRADQLARRELRRVRRPNTPHPASLAVITLRNAFKSLSEHDFRRLAPPSAIDGWASDAAAPLRVIPARDLTTFLRTGDYFLLFRSRAAATLYRRYALSRHRESRLHVPVERGPRVAPAPRIRPDGRMEETAARFALASPMLALQMRVQSAPFNPRLRGVVEAGGYDALLAGAQSAHEVLVWFEGAGPTMFALRGAVRRDGEERGCAWATVGEMNGVREVRIHHLDPHPGSPRRAEGQVPVAKFAQRYLKRFIVSFETEAEARRFVMDWHRRDPGELGLEGGQDSEVVNCEYLW